jgi:dihydroneopterin aldolase
MVFYGYHGAFSAERELGQKIEVDVELKGDYSRAGKSDDLDLSVNYIDVYTVVKEIVEEGEFNLIEAMGTAIADQIMDSFEVEQLTVRVRKPQPPLGGIVNSSEFEIVRDNK